jgi:putative transcriptional regulator
MRFCLALAQARHSRPAGKWRCLHTNACQAARGSGTIVAMARALWSFIIIALLTVGLPGGRQRAAHAEAHRSVAGQFLVAAPSMPDPRFDGTVILMVQHTDQGALGLVVNRVNGHRPIAEILAALGHDAAGVKGSMDIHWGGPVESNVAVVLHSPDFKGKGTRLIPGGFALTSTPGVLQALGRGKGPKQAIFVRGYAGWGPGQLERELATNAWVVVPADSKLVFSRNHADTWRRAYARRGTEL